jgi:hypothetical protein
MGFHFHRLLPLRLCDFARESNSSLYDYFFPFDKVYFISNMTSPALERIDPVT